MTLETLSSPWTAAFANHLWQSTLVAAVAGLLTLVLRKNQARTRYWLWMAASIKFLIPFSWLVALGSKLAWSHATASNDGVYVVIGEVSQPFTRFAMPAPPIAPAASSFLHLLPSILIAVWLCGLVTVLMLWLLRWHRISATLRSAVPIHEGREVDALRRLERISGLRTRIELLLSRAMLEPGIFGMTRPVLVWPEGISERLETPHLEAILAHELCHVRRRDNLAAALHMLVEAIFWFHPLVWWLGSRLIDERERACDEEVLEFGSDRHVYAESILKVCEFCVGSPLACVSGVTGADLKKRMVHIMSEYVVRKLDFTRRLLLSAVAVLAIATPIIFGLAHATPSRAQSQDAVTAGTAPGFDSVSIKPSELNTTTYAGTKTRMVKMMFGPDGYQASNVTMRSLIQEAYGVQANQILGGPEWLDSAAYDVVASTKHTAETKDPKESGTPGLDKNMRMQHEKMRHMLQGILADRAKLVLHGETKDLPNYILSVSDGGSKLQPAQPGEVVENTIARPGNPENEERRLKIDAEGRAMMEHRMFMQTNGDQVMGIAAQGVSLEEITRQISMQLGVNVVDKTGLKGSYDFNLHWTAGGSDNASYIGAVQEQLGLNLQQQTAPTQVLVIDHIEKPEEVTSASRE